MLLTLRHIKDRLEAVRDGVGECLKSSVTDSHTAQPPASQGKTQSQLVAQPGPTL